jgi:hypothetical protein
LVRSGTVLCTFLCFAIFVAIESLDVGKSDGLVDESSSSSAAEEDVPIPFDLVRRTRMVVSTVETFLESNWDRCLKSIVEYTKSKAVKAVTDQRSKPVDGNVQS